MRKLTLYLNETHTQDLAQLVAKTLIDICVHWYKANRADPDETAPTGAVLSGSILFAANAGLGVPSQLKSWLQVAHIHALAQHVAKTLIDIYTKANKADPDKTAPAGAVLGGSFMFAANAGIGVPSQLESWLQVVHTHALAQHVAKTLIDIYTKANKADPDKTAPTGAVLGVSFMFAANAGLWVPSQLESWLHVAHIHALAQHVAKTLIDIYTKSKQSRSG